MNIRRIGYGLAIVVVLSGPTLVAYAEQTNPPSPPSPPAAQPVTNRMEALREELKQMTPEQRRAKIQELREAGFFGLTNRAGNVPVTAEERQARIEEIRKQRAETNGVQTNLALHSRPGDRLEELRRKKRDKTITPAEQQQLERTEALLTRMQTQRPPAGVPMPLTNSIVTNRPALK